MSALRLDVLLAALATLVIAAPPTTAVAQNRAASPAAAAKPWAPPRTPWGDPDLQGTYTNKDESGIPMEQPAEFAGKSVGRRGRLRVRRASSRRAAAADGGSARRGSAATTPAPGPTHWYENYNAKNSRAVADRRSGGRQDPAARPRTRRSAPLPRCRRGAKRRGPGRLVDGPQPLRPLHHAWRARLDDAGDLRQLLRHHAGARIRRHPLRDDSRDARHSARRPPQLASSISSRTWATRAADWEGNTLVVETTNFHRPQSTYRGADREPAG